MKFLKYIKRSIVPALALICVVAAGSMLTSCEEEEKMTEVVLHSFGPSGVQHGDKIKFIGLNLDKVSAIVLPPGIEVTNFESKSAGVIEIIVPKEAEAGKVVLKTPQGDIESKSMLSFEAPVVISSITEEARPGGTITLTGDLLNWIESVTFEGGLVVEEFESKSLTELVVRVPMEAQTGYLIFSTGGTEPLTFASEEELIVTLPVVTELNPSAIVHTEDLTITGTDLDLVTSVVLGGDVTVTSEEFVSQSATGIVVTVPATTVKGAITLKQASPVEIVTSQELTIILPTATSATPNPAVPGEDVMVITGENLNLVAELKLPGAGSITDFLSHTETEISFDIPASATQGAINYVTIHGYEAALEGALLKLPPTGGFPTLDYYIYSDGLQNGWEAWGGWGHVSQEFDNTDNPANGEEAIKTVFNDAYGAMQLHNSGGTNVFDGYNYLVFYVYVEGEESDVIVQIDNNTDYYPAHFTGDKYHQIVVPLADLEGSDNVSELRIKNNNSDAPTNNTTVYIDEIGLTVEEPMGLLPDLVAMIYDDELHAPFTTGGWGAATTDWANEENFRGGDYAIKATYEGNWAGNGQLGTWETTPLSTAGMETLAFSIYGGPGTEGNSIQINVKPTVDGATASVQVVITEGKWTDYEVPLSEVGDPATIGEVSFQNTEWTGTIFIDQVGLK